MGHDLSSQPFPLPHALFPWRQGSGGFLGNSSWEPPCLLLPQAALGQEHLILPLLTLVCHSLTLESSLKLVLMASSAFGNEALILWLYVPRASTQSCPS